MRRRRLLSGGLVAIGLIALCAIAAGVSQATAPRTFRSHRDTIVDALERRTIVYHDVLLIQSFEERNNVQFYRASVQVILPDQSIAYGWIGCENRDSECFLDIRPLGIRGVALPDLTPARPHPWRVWLERAVRTLDWRAPLSPPTPQPPRPTVTPEPAT